MGRSRFQTSVCQVPEFCPSSHGPTSTGTMTPPMLRAVMAGELARGTLPAALESLRFLVDVGLWMWAEPGGPESGSLDHGCGCGCGQDPARSHRSLALGVVSAIGMLMLHPIETVCANTCRIAASTHRGDAQSLLADAPRH